MRPGCLVALGLVLVGAIVTLVGMAWLGRGDGGIDLGPLERYALRQPVYRSSDGLFVVRLSEEEVIALSDIDPHNPPGRRSCRVTFRPDLGGTATATGTAAGRAGSAASTESGRFFDVCSGAEYNVTGGALGGDGLDLERVSVSQDQAGRLRAYPER